MRDFKASATRLRQLASEYGFTVEARGCIVSVTKRITPNDGAAFADAETGASILLDLAPQTQPGSVWGTDGLSIGGLSAMRSGVFKMNKSGVSKRMISALSRA